MATMALIGGGMILGGAVGGGVMANQALKKAEAKANEATRLALADLQRVGIPNEEAQRIVLQHPQYIFKYAPELEQYYELGKSQLHNITVDPRSRDAQMSALEKLQYLGQEGLTDSDRAELRMARSQVAGEAQARDAAIIQNLAERGQLGTGQELAMRSISSQQAAQRQSEQTDRQIKMAQEKALQSILQGAELGGQIRGQEFAEQAKIYGEDDANIRNNIFTKQNVQQRNVASANQAQLMREQLRQDLENQRAATANQQEIHNKGLLQQRFENELNKAGLISGIYNNQATNLINSGKEKAQAWSNAGQGITKAGGELFKA